MSSDGVKGPWTQQELYFKDELTAMAKLPENQECADCTSKAPRWAVYNHGIFVCIKCSGQHRNLGTDISMVRSINLDRWKQHQFDMMVGNEVANANLLYNLPPGMHKPEEGEDYQRQKWIENKYRKWARKPNQEQQQPVEQTPPPQASERSRRQETPPVVPVPMQAVPMPQPVVKVSMPVPQPVPVVTQPTPPQVDDLLDIFGVQPTAQAPPPPVVVQQAYVPQQQPKPSVTPPINNPRPVQAAPQPVQQFAQAPKPMNTAQQQYQQAQKKDEFADIMDMYDKPAAPAPVQQQVQEQPAAKKGFDINAFITQSAPKQAAGQYNYKPQGFDW